MKDYYVYIVSSISKTLYIGVTNDIRRRMLEHKTGAVPGFTLQYQINRLVYYEPFLDSRAAIDREKEIKRWGRKRKLCLIELNNPGWADLSDGWGLPSEIGGSVVTRLIHQDPSPPSGQAQDDKK